MYKYLMRINEIVNESASADLYHGTSLENAEQILDSNTLYPGDGGHGDEGAVSLTRDFGVAKNIAAWTDPAGVVLVLDQARIRQRTRLQPYDYGGGEDEAEETSQRPITNVNSVIKQIIVLKHDDFDAEDYPLVMNDPRTRVVDQESIPQQTTARQFNRLTSAS
jgi:hypothetical protein